METEQSSSEAPEYISGLNDSSSEDQILLDNPSISISRTNSKKSLRQIKEPSHLKIKNLGMNTERISFKIDLNVEHINIPISLRSPREEFKLIDQPNEEKEEDNQKSVVLYSHNNDTTFSIPKSIPNIKTFFDFNKDFITLSMCERLNCFVPTEVKIAYKNFNIISRKTVNQVSRLSVLNLELLQKLKDIEEIKTIIDSAKDFQNQECSLLSIYHLFHLMKHFPKSFNSLNKSSVIENVLKSTKKSVEFVNEYRKKVKLSIELLITRNFQAFVVFFMKLSTGESKNFKIDDIEEEYIDLVFKETLN